LQVRVQREREHALEACVAGRRRPHHHVEAEDRPDALRAHDVRDGKASQLVARPVGVLDVGLRHGLGVALALVEADRPVKRREARVLGMADLLEAGADPASRIAGGGLTVVLGRRRQLHEQPRRKLVRLPRGVGDPDSLYGLRASDLGAHGQGQEP
jgi:hypothetical protein